MSESDRRHLLDEFARAVRTNISTATRDPDPVTAAFWKGKAEAFAEARIALEESGSAEAELRAVRERCGELATKLRAEATQTAPGETRELLDWLSAEMATLAKGK